MLGNCSVCNRPMTKTFPGQPLFHTDRSYSQDICVACATITVELQKYLLRTLDRTLWTKQAHKLIGRILSDVRNNKA